MSAVASTHAGAASLADHEILIEPGAKKRDYWSDIWRYRELFLLLAWRDLTVRFRQTIIGIVWAVLRPLFTMTIFTVIFGRVAGLPSDGAPYPLVVFSGLLPWTLFAAGLSEASNSLVNNQHLIGKVYFPRLIIPASALVTPLVDALIGFALLVLLMLYYGVGFQPNIIFLPAFLALTLLLCLGPGLLLAGLNVKYRDFRLVVPFIVQLGVFLSPVGFSSTAIPERWQAIYGLNPLVGVIDGFRWCILGDSSPLDPTRVMVSVVVGLAFLWLGVRSFRRTEDVFADLI